MMMLYRACCSKCINKTSWDNLHREDEALVLGLMGSEGVGWVGADGRMALAYGTALVKTEMWFLIVHCPEFGSHCGMWCPCAVAPWLSQTRGIWDRKGQASNPPLLPHSDQDLKNIFECIVKHHYVVCSNWKFVINMVRLAELADGGVGNIVFLLQGIRFCKLWEEF